MGRRERRESKLLPLTGQVEAWIRTQILTGALETGARLPKPETIARRFAVNTNTVREALSRLHDQGVLDVRHGTGTFVAARIDRERAANIRTLLSEMVERGRQLELTADEIATAVWAFDIDARSRTFWLADVRHPYLSAFAETLEKHLHGPVRILRLDDPEGNDGEAPVPGARDAVLAPIRLVGEVRSRFPEVATRLFPLRIKLNVKGLVELAALPAAKRLGCICVEEQFARTMGRSIARQGIGLPQSYAAISDRSSVELLERDCDAFVVSTAAYDEVRKRRFDRTLKPLVKLQYEIDLESIETVKHLMNEAAARTGSEKVGAN